MLCSLSFLYKDLICVWWKREITPKALPHFHFYGFGGGSGEPDKEGAVPLALAMLPLCVVLMEGSNSSLTIESLVITLSYVGSNELMDFPSLPMA